MSNIAKKQTSTEATTSETSLQQEHLELNKNYFKLKYIWISILLFFLSALLTSVSSAFIPIISYLMLALSAIFMGCGTSLLIAILFTLSYEKTVGKWQTKILSQSIANELNSDFVSLQQSIINESKQLELNFAQNIETIEKKYCGEIYKNLGKYLPIKRFPRSNSPNPEYNEMLTESFLNTYNYKFRGTQGIFIPIRLENLYEKKRDIKNLSVEVLIFDPRDDSALKLHAKEHYKDNYMTDDEKLNKVKESIFQAIIGLFDVRNLTSIQLRLYRDSIFYRSEIFDSSVFITFYNQRQNFDTYPPSYQYDKKTIYYDIFDRDFKQTWLLATERIEFNVNSSQDQLESFLQELGCNKEINELREVYKQKKLEKTNQLINP